MTQFVNSWDKIWQLRLTNDIRRFRTLWLAAYEQAENKALSTCRLLTMANCPVWRIKCELEWATGSTETTPAMEKRENEMRKQKGFSLIELLIVVAIILIIAAIAIPNLLRARIAANESAAVSAVRTINTAEVTYSTTYPTVGYAPALANLGGPAAVCGSGGSGPVQATACLIDDVLAQATAAPGKSGYTYAATPVATGTINTSYTVGASPLNFNQSGVRNFCSNDDGVLRFDPGASGSAPVTTAAACNAFSVLN
jgi:type IV pilus assembly protein PilA